MPKVYTSYPVWPPCDKGELKLFFWEKSTFFAAPEVVMEFSAAWYLSIVSQAAKATYIRAQSTQYNSQASQTHDSKNQPNINDLCKRIE